MAGYVPAGAKKLPERRSLSRVSLPVLTEFMSTVAVAADWERVPGGDDLGLERVEPPADLAHHHVAGHETDVRVDGIEVPGARHVTGDLDSRCGHDCPSGSPFSRSKLRPWLRSVAGCTTRAR